MHELLGIWNFAKHDLQEFVLWQIAHANKKSNDCAVHENRYADAKIPLHESRPKKKDETGEAEARERSVPM